MKIETLKERIAKNEIKIEKKYALIEKKEQQIEKVKNNLMKKYGVDADTFDRYDKQARYELGKGDQGSWEIYWDMCKIEDLKDDIRRLPNEIKEVEAIIEKQKKQLAGEIEKESLFVKEVPEVLKKLEAELIKEWDRWDMERRERIRKARAEMEYREFRRMYTFADSNFATLTDSEIHESNARFARAEILDLFNRVKAITGEITSCENIYLESGNTFPVLNGYVIGKAGRASVESIHAGGYNIQRLHIRTLVKEF